MHYMVLKVRKHVQKGTGNERQTGTRGYSSAGRAPALQAGGHRFESVYLHHSKGCVRGEQETEVRRRGLIAQPVRAHA